MDFERSSLIDSWFLKIALIAGVGFLFLTPPMQVADEPAHFLKSFQLSELTVIGTKSGGLAGGFLPKSLHQVINLTIQGLPFNPQARVDRKQLLTASKIPLEPDKREMAHFPNPVLYAPIPYLPQAVGLWVGRLMGANPLAAFYLARLANLLLATLLIYLAVKITPTFKWSLLLLGLTPIVCFQRSSLSCDAFIHAGSLLFFAGILRMASSASNAMKIRLKALVFSLGVALTLCKQAYGVILFAFLLVPRSHFPSQRAYWKYFGSLLGVSFVLMLAWSILVRDLYVPTIAGNELGGQLKYVLAYPHRVLYIVAHHLWFNFFPLRDQFVGQLGWLDTSLPQWLRDTYMWVFVGLALFENSSLRFSLRQRILALNIFVWGCIGVASLIYLTGMPVGAQGLAGIQGRYLVPFLPFLLIVLDTSGLQISYRIRATLSSVFNRAIPLWASVGLGITLYTLSRRYFF